MVKSRNRWQPRWWPLLLILKTSSSATTRKIYLNLLRRSQAFTEAKIISKYCNISKTLGKGSIYHARLPPLPCTTGVWIWVYVRGLKISFSDQNHGLWPLEKFQWDDSNISLFCLARKACLSTKHNRTLCLHPFGQTGNNLKIVQFLT